MAEGMLGQLKREGAWYATGYAITRLASLAMIPLYSRWLAPAELGSADYLLAIVSVTAVIASCEIGQGLARFFPEESSEEKRRMMASTALCLALLGSALSAIMLAVALPSRDEPLAGPYTYVLLGMLLISQCGSQILHYQLRWSGRAAAAMLASSAMSLLTVLTAILLVGLLAWGVSGFLLAQIVGNIALGGTAWFLGRGGFSLRIHLLQAKRMLGYSLPLVPSSLAVVGALYADRLFVEHMLSVRELGVYSMAARIAAVSQLFLAPLRMALTPIVYRSYRSAEVAVELASLRRWLILICGPAMLCLCAFSHELYVFAVETEYHSGHALVGLIMLGSVLGNLYMFTPGLDIARRTWTITAVNLAALCVNFTLNALLLKPFGVIGAGLAFCAGGLAMCIGYERLGHAHYPVASSHPELAYLILPTLLMTSLVYSAPGGTAAPIAVRAVALAALLVAMYAWARSRLGVRRGINAGISVE